MTLAVDIKHRLGTFLLNVTFEADGGLIALFGRSGSGKTSVINCIAGLTRPDQARIEIDGTVLVDTARGKFVPPHRRRVGYVFQEGRLFPHLTVRQNLLYGRWFTGVGKAGAALDRVVDLLGIGHLAHRRPGKLSGGEKQRVAIGRALLAEPRILLMDEPLASLDEDRKGEILPYIERLRDGSKVPIVYVSHSLAEVARLATTIVLVADGRVATAGPAADIMQRLDISALTGRTDTGAVVEATVERHDDALRVTELSSRAGRWRLNRIDAPVNARLRLQVHARDVILAKVPPLGISALNVLRGVVAEVGALDQGTVEVRVDCNGEALVARLTRYSAEQLGLAPGVPIFAVVKGISFDRHSAGGPRSGPPGINVEASDA
ncbi:MAG TPA: molybdenum ABC transporter ATP-binding protein [Hyphomicrobiaceae bacterium]|nr:molybdenum ABC transporter ATP-binding protein [Hyphomicrobiaceae bacterium]